MASFEASRKTRRSARYNQLKPYLTSLLPIGGLLALGLTFTEAPVAPNASDAVSETLAHATLVSEPDNTRPLPLVAAAERETRAPQLLHRAQVGSPSTAAKTRLQRPIAQRHIAPQHTAEQHSAPQDTANKLRLAAEPTHDSPSPTFVEASQVLASTVAPSPTPHMFATPAQTLTERDTFSEQVQALKRADRALKGGDTSGAKAALARPFSPQLVLHADALRAVLACQSNDRATGKRYLNAQAKSHPNSPYLDRMRRACGMTTLNRD
jgi:hypothetical protein